MSDDGTAMFQLIAAVIQVTGAAITAYDAIKHSTGLPAAFREVGSSLPLIKDTLETLKQALGRQELDKDNDQDAGKGLDKSTDKDAAKVAHRVLEKCNDKIQKLQEIFEKLTPKESKKSAAYTVKQYAKALWSVTKGSTVETLTRDVFRDLEILHSNSTLKLLLGDKIARNNEATSKLQEIAASDPSISKADLEAYQPGDDATAYHNNQYGTGKMNIHQGRGDMYNGTTYSAKTQNFGSGGRRGRHANSSSEDSD